MKAASCPHHWISTGATHLTADAEGAKLVVGLACILCFKFTSGDFRSLGYALDAKTIQTQRAMRKARKP